MPDDPSSPFRTLAAQAIARCREIATHTEIPGETTRTFLSPAAHAVQTIIAGWMQAAGMQVHTDPAGNLRGLLGPTAAPRLVIASHLDTVPNAGPFDGILGVLLGIALTAHTPHLPYAIEVIGFSEEEGVRFRKPFLGSLAATGQLSPAMLALPDAQGITVAEAIRSFGLDPAAIHDARLSPKTFACLEIHIEQGPILESLNLPLGLVTALVGQTRMEFTFTGHANHAGTTPMHLRQDALAAAAQWITEVERLAQTTPGLVATVGRLETHPGAGNIIPARATALLDVRHASDSTRLRAVERVAAAATTCAAARRVVVSPKTLLDQPAVSLDPHLTQTLAHAAAQAGLPAHPMTSGAGHDAMILAPHLPTAMLFLRSPGGISHHPAESVLLEDVAAALAVAHHFLNTLTPHPPQEAPCTISV